MKKGKKAQKSHNNVRQLFKVLSRTNHNIVSVACIYSYIHTTFNLDSHFCSSDSTDDYCACLYIRNTCTRLCVCVWFVAQWTGFKRLAPANKFQAVKSNTFATKYQHHHHFMSNGINSCNGERADKRTRYIQQTEREAE